MGVRIAFDRTKQALTAHEAAVANHKEKLRQLDAATEAVKTAKKELENAEAELSSQTGHALIIVCDGVLFVRDYGNTYPFYRLVEVKPFTIPQDEPRAA